MGLKTQPEGRTQLCLCPLLNIPLNISPKRRGIRYEEALRAFSIPRAGKQQPFPTPSLKGRAVSSLCAQNSDTPPPHALSSRAAAPFPSSCLITEKICGPGGRKANLSDKRQAAEQGSAGKGIRAVPRKHALTSGHRRHRAPCSRSLN